MSIWIRSFLSQEGHEFSIDVMTTELKRPSPEALLAKLKGGEKPTLRVYIGAAPGVAVPTVRSSTSAISSLLRTRIDGVLGNSSR